MHAHRATRLLEANLDIASERRRALLAVVEQDDCVQAVGALAKATFSGDVAAPGVDTTRAFNGGRAISREADGRQTPMRSRASQTGPPDLHFRKESLLLKVSLYTIVVLLRQVQRSAKLQMP
jgi:hypothetical protein